MTRYLHLYVQCLDLNSGETGDYLGYDDGRAVSPVFGDLAPLFLHMNARGLYLDPVYPEMPSRVSPAQKG